MGNYLQAQANFQIVPFYVVDDVNQNARLSTYFSDQEFDKMRAVIARHPKLRAIDATAACLWALDHLPQDAEKKFFSQYQISVGGVHVLKISLVSPSSTDDDVCKFGVTRE